MTATPFLDPPRYWNEVAGPGWVAVQPLLDRQLAPFDEALMARARPAPGERVLDVGCGCGGSTLALARAVAPGGEVIGVDLSAPMLARAKARLEEEGVKSVVFQQADAGGQALAASRFDLVYSRFGMMFFPDPLRAFRNLRGALRPGGRLAFVCWQSLAQNVWMAGPLAAAAPHVPLLAPPPPGAPGPFSLADAARVHAILADAGFADAHCESLETTLAPGGGGRAEALEMLLTIGPVAAALREADADAAMRSAVTRALEQELARWASPQGLRMPAAAWLVTARRPA